MAAQFGACATDGSGVLFVSQDLFLPLVDISARAIEGIFLKFVIISLKSVNPYFIFSFNCSFST